MLKRADLEHRAVAAAAVQYRAAAAALDGLVMICLAAPSGLITMALQFFFNGGFDRLGRGRALGGWVFLSVLAATWMLYLARDLFGGGPAGGAATFRLYVDAGDDAGAKRRIATWLVLNHLPLFMFAATCWTCCAHTILQDVHTFADVGWSPSWLSFAPTLVLLGLSTVSLAFAIGPERRALYDRLAGVRVVRPTFLQRGGARGFAVEDFAKIPVAQPVDAIRDHLEEAFAPDQDDLPAIRKGLDQLNRDESIPWEDFRPLLDR